MSEPFDDYRQQMLALAPQAMAELAAIMNDQNAPAMTRLRAAKLILNLAYGRPRPERAICEHLTPEPYL
jgi:hypothetical protein